MKMNEDDELFSFDDYLKEDVQKKTLEPDPEEKEMELGDEFKKILSLVENSNDSYFITGKAGTGKSTLLKHLRKTTKKQIVVLAPTGIAAVNVDGQTIHSFFRFPPEILFPDTVRRIGGKDIFRTVETIIIDEISMVRSDVMDAMDTLLRGYGKSSHKPFGGIQMVFFGDLYQLPPVTRREDADAFYSMYKSPWFFGAKVMDELKLKTFELTKIYRQTETEFIDILEKIRNNTMQQEDLNKINALCDPFTERPEEDMYVTLTTINQTAKEINNQKLATLSGAVKLYTATVEGLFKEDAFPTERVLSLKKNAQVIFLKNDTEGRWVNGTIGRVESMHNDHIMVEIKTEYGTSIQRVERATWSNIKYEVDRASKKVRSKEVGKFKQYPLKLAFAISVHKSQGQTFDKVDLHFGNGAFASGQAYVALSRCRTLSGIKLLTRLSHRDIILDNQVVEFIERSKYLEENPLQ